MSDVLIWNDPARARAFALWLAGLADAQRLRTNTVRPASADASFRRYFRVDTQEGESRIIMDAPPEHEDCAAFVRIAGLMQTAGLNVPRILTWDQAQGFMLLTDLGAQTMLEVIAPERAAAAPSAYQSLYLQAVDALLPWQQASQPDVLPPYDEALLRRELELFPDWYLAQHRGVAVQGPLRETLNQTFDLIVRRVLAAPQVFVHRDFMPRNLIVPSRSPAAHGALLPEGAAADLGRPGVGGIVPPAGSDEQRLGVLDFQDAVYGPITYDIASLMRDAFLSWDEEFVLDITIRYWERARKLGLMDFEDWSRDFGSFWRAVEWMGLQRHLKVAGIFARLTLRDGKPKYLADAPRFIGYIRHTAARYRELTPLLKLIDQVEDTPTQTAWSFGRV
ncbi:MAG: phosphotransferase [Burkholderiaceae bacterium]|jgi:aminoglycoside/choline kinase family phosphotransferase|nr:phosphotransferase [Burkholderiaceae bacterium]